MRRDTRAGSDQAKREIRTVLNVMSLVAAANAALPALATPTERTTGMRVVVAGAALVVLAIAVYLDATTGLWTRCAALVVILAAGAVVATTDWGSIGWEVIVFVPLLLIPAIAKLTARK